MPLSLRPRRPSPSLRGPFTVRSDRDRDRRALRKALTRAFEDLDRRAQRSGCEVSDIQLLARVCGAASYEQFKRDQERAWKRQGGAFSTAAWPAKLSDGENAVVLLPLQAGRVGLAVSKQPRAIASPVFACGASPTGGRHEDMVLGLVTNWAASPADRQSARLAPPVLEVIQRGSVVERRVVDFGQAWPLPAPDGM